MSGRRRRLAGLGVGMLAPPPVGVVRLGSVIGAGLMRTTRARRRSCTPCRGPRHSAAPPPCKAAPRPPGTRPSPTPTFSRRRTRPRARGYPPSPRTRLCCRPPLSPTRARRTWLPSTRRARSAVGWAPCPPPSAWGSGAASLRHRRLGEGGVARLPAGRPVHACTSAQHRMHAAVEVAASMHKKAVRALLLVARETHPGNKGGTSFAAGRARPQVLAVARGARSTPR